MAVHYNSSLYANNMYSLQKISYLGLYMIFDGWEQGKNKNILNI